VNTKLF